MKINRKFMNQNTIGKRKVNDWLTKRKWQNEKLVDDFVEGFAENFYFNVFVNLEFSNGSRGISGKCLFFKPRT